MHSNIIIEGMSAAEFLEQIESMFGRQIKDLQEKLARPPDQLWDRKYVADLFQISLPTLRKMVENGVIKEYRLGKSIRYKSQEIMSVFEEREKKRKEERGKI
jgi:excisionase family DNA binding protein